MCVYDNRKQVSWRMKVPHCVVRPSQKALKADERNGGCVDLTVTGGSPKIRKFCRRHLSIAPYSVQVCKDGDEYDSEEVCMEQETAVGLSLFRYRNATDLSR